jgi:hypothetical protein
MSYTVALLVPPAVAWFTLLGLLIKHVVDNSTAAFFGIEVG